MNESIRLLGTSDVRQAGNNFIKAAGEINQAAINLQSILERQKQFMDCWLDQFESIMESNTPEPKAKGNTDD